MFRFYSRCGCNASVFSVIVGCCIYTTDRNIPLSRGITVRDKTYAYVRIIVAALLAYGTFNSA